MGTPPPLWLLMAKDAEEERLGEQPKHSRSSVPSIQSLQGCFARIWDAVCEVPLSGDHFLFLLYPDGTGEVLTRGAAFWELIRESRGDLRPSKLDVGWPAGGLGNGMEMATILAPMNCR